MNTVLHETKVTRIDTKMLRNGSILQQPLQSCQKNTDRVRISGKGGDDPVRLRSQRSLTTTAALCLKLLLLLHLLTLGKCYIREDSHSTLKERYRTRTVPKMLYPQFDLSQSGNVTALADKTALLNCRVHNAGNLSVSWVRHRDIHLLTVGPYTYTSDQRFRVVHERDSDDWILKIAYVQPRDSGVYECQVSTTPPTSHFISLNVVEPQTTILGGPDIHINKGSTINLTCVIQFSPEPPDYIFWNHNHKIIGYDSPRGGVTVIIEKGDETICTLLIQRARVSDSGLYECQPANAASANITVHVLNGEQPAAIQHGGQANYSSSSGKILLFLLVFLIGHDKFLK
uniref:Lachesin-like n=1 Tax=Hirondellea gigas TaxID=1518452 RepID=A0A6A7G484_9CRUS